MQHKTMDQMAPLLIRHWGNEKGSKILQAADRRLEQLCAENTSVPKAVKAHTYKEIFPCISLYEALQANGISQAEALEFLDTGWSQKAQAGAARMKKILKFAGLYKLYPALFQWVAKKQFGTAAGFQASFYSLGRRRCKFDMKKCLFLDTCRKYGCPELTQCFCHVDDINNAGLHPKLCWNRTKFMGGGGEVCDFDIFIKG